MKGISFKRCLAETYVKWGKETAVSNPRSIVGSLYDVCKDDIPTKKKIEAFEKITERINIFEALIEKGDAESVSIAYYQKVSDVISEASFKGIVEIIKEIIDTNGECFEDEEDTAAQSGNPQANNIAVRNNPPSKPKKQNSGNGNGAVVQAANPQPNKKLAVRNNPPAAKPKKQNNGKPVNQFNTPAVSTSSGAGKVFGVIAAILVITGIVLLSVFGKRMTWTQWQWVIGSLGGLLLFGIATLVYIILDAECFTACYFGMIILIALTILDTILGYTLKLNYQIIFFWFSGYSLIFGAICFFLALDDVEDGVATVIVITGIVLIGMMIGVGVVDAKANKALIEIQANAAAIEENSEYSQNEENVVQDEQSTSKYAEAQSDLAVSIEGFFQKIFPSIQWWQCQWILGAIGGLIVAGILYMLSAIFSGGETYYISPFTMGFLLILNTVLSFVLKTDYSIISHWVSSYVIIASVISGVYAIDDVEEPWSIPSFIEGGLGVLLIILVATII